VHKALLILAKLVLKSLFAFFYELSGLFFSHFIQFVLAGLILVMVNFERKRTRSKEFVYLTLGFMLLCFQQYFVSTVLGLNVIAHLAPVEEYSALLEQALELFALIILTTAFLYPIAKNKESLQRIMAYNLLSAVGVSLAVFISYRLRPSPVEFGSHWGAWLFASLDLVLLCAIITYTLMARRKYALLVVAAASLWAFIKVCVLYNIAVFGSAKNTLFVLSQTLPIGVYALLSVAIYRQIAREYMRLHQATLKSKKRLQAIFDGITDGIIILDRDFRILNVNESERKFLGLPASSIIGEVCYRLYGRGEKPCPGCPALSAFESGRRASAAFHTSRKSHQEASFFEEEAFPLYKTSGRVSQVIVYIKDTSERHRIEERLRALDRLAAIGEMSTRIAHEIRNPLEAISGSAEYLAETVQSELVRQFTKIIREESRRLSNLTESLLNYAKPIQLNLASGNINTVVKETARLMKPEIDEAGAKFKLEVGDDLPNTVFDRHLIKQTIINMLINSLEAIDGSGKVVLATSFRRPGTASQGEEDQEPQMEDFVGSAVSHYRLGNEKLLRLDHVAIYCRDTGKGIPKDIINSIFKPFFTTKLKGTGLGLATIQRITAEHDGLVEVFSKPGAGTLFVIRLPVSLAKRGADPALQ